MGDEWQQFSEKLLNADNRAWAELCFKLSNDTLKDQELSALKRLVQSGEADDEALINAKKLLHAVIIFHQLDVEQGREQAYPMLKEQAEAHQPIAQLYLGYCYQMAIGVEESESKSFEYILAAYQEGYFVAAYDLALCFYYGYGVSPDKDKANYYFREIEDKGYVSEWIKVCQFYEQAQIEAYDEQHICSIYIKAAESGDAYAQYQYALRLFTGKGCQQNIEQAVYYGDLSARGGNNDAACRLARYYQQGRYLATNIELAIRYYRLAAINQSAQAYFQLAKIYQQNMDDELLHKIFVDYYFKSYCINGNYKSLAALQETGIQDNDFGSLARSYLFIIYFCGLQIKNDKQKALMYCKENEGKVLNMVYCIVGSQFNDISFPKHVINKLAKYLLKRSNFNDFIDVNPGKYQKIIFEPLIEISKNKIKSGFDKSNNSLLLLRQMAEKNIQGAQEALTDALDNMALRLSYLIKKNFGNRQAHLQQLLRLACEEGNKTAQNKIREIREVESQRLCQEALSIRSRHRARILKGMSAYSTEALTQLGIYYLKRRCHHSFVIRFFTAEKEKNHQKAFQCFQIAAQNNYGPAYYQLGLCYQLGIGTKLNMKLALMSYYMACYIDDDKKSLNKITQLCKDKRDDVSIDAYIYRALLSKTRFVDLNRSVESALRKNKTHSVSRIIEIANNTVDNFEGKIRVLYYVLDRKVDSRSRLMLETGIKELIFSKLFTTNNISDITWLKYIDAKLFMKFAVEIDNIHEISFLKRALVLKIAEIKARKENINPKPIVKALEPYLVSENEILAVDEFLASVRIPAKRPTIEPLRSKKQKAHAHHQATQSRIKTNKIH